MSRKILTSLILNIVISVLVFFGSIAIFVGFNFMGSVGRLDAAGFEMYKYFTIQSNVLAGIAATILIIYELLFIKGKINKLPNWIYVLKLVGTVGVTVTFLVTAFYLTIVLDSPWYLLYTNSNLIFHGIVPIICVISFIFFENNQDLKAFSIFIGISHMILYCIYYVTNVLVHLENGQAPLKYDWYMFAQAGMKYVPIVVVIMIGFTIGVSFILYLGNKKIGGKNNEESSSN